MIEAGSLQREDVTESIETMRGYNCEIVYSEREPFNPTNLMLFGMVTGFTVGTMVTRKAHPTMVIATHHGEGERCHYCNYGTKNQSECPCPDCVGDARGKEYRRQVEVHGMAPPHKDGSLASICRVCQRNGWAKEEDPDPNGERTVKD